ncbi:MAG: 6-carboxytetrahydropterin synthase [Pseudonocardiaceae bacterium]|nr:6-carboxytetrahydropterin synthase [Pseudonocardiaceae bacterium]
MHTVTVAHNFETAHRLPHLPGKCQSLHGHSWWAEVTVSAPDTDESGVVVEFGEFKAALREFIDLHLDHGVMLGLDDPLVDVLNDGHTKVHVMTDWPTVENVAAMLAEIAGQLLSAIPRVSGATVTAVEVRETHVNRAGWTP